MWNISKKMNFIRNQNKVLCKECKHYIPPTKHNTQGKCSLFGETNLETGEIEYIPAIQCRKDSSFGTHVTTNCGVYGIYFEFNKIN